MLECAGRTDAYTRITNKIISDLERGELTWRKPWSSEHLAGRIERPLRWNSIPYTGVNVFMLWATAAEQGLTSPYWLTFKQAQILKANVKKGEKGAMVVYADDLVLNETNKEGELVARKIPYLKTYTVFNANQIDNLPEKYYEVPEIKSVNLETRNQELEFFFSQTKAEITTGTKAAYFIGQDRVEMPPFESFIDGSRYYATLAHELTHWTRHPKRLDRNFGRKYFGDEGYAKEELVAEFGSCFLAADLGLEPETPEDHVAYIQSWLSVLKNDKRFIFSAASHAHKAVEYIHGLQSSKLLLSD